MKFATSKERMDEVRRIESLVGRRLPNAYRIHLSESVSDTRVIHHFNDLPIELYCLLPRDTPLRKNGILSRHNDFESSPFARQLDWMLDGAPKSDLPERTKNFICIGQYNGDPIALDIVDRTVWILYHDGLELTQLSDSFRDFKSQCRVEVDEAAPKKKISIERVKLQYYMLELIEESLKAAALSGVAVSALYADTANQHFRKDFDGQVNELLDSKLDLLEHLFAR